MTIETPRSSTSQAREDYNRARQRALVRRFWSAVTGQRNALIPYEDLRKSLGIRAQNYRGLQPVPLDKIVGSMGRSQDFDRAFLPTQRHSRGKWVSVDQAYLTGVTLPPISLYKVGEVYFVVDGHHRVSVARRRGQTFIDAEVIEVQSRVPVTTDLSLDDLDDLAAHRDFMDQTSLDTLRPEQEIRLTMPGDYTKLLDHIRVHKYYVDQEESRDLSWEEGVTHWYDHVYAPLANTIRRGRLLDDFAGHTVADLYIWIIEHAHYLSQDLGRDLRPWEAAMHYAQRFSRRPKRLINRVWNFLKGLVVPDELEAGPRAGTWRQERIEPTSDQHLFRDILVTLTGAESGWLALSQAAEFARRENSTINGLHVATSRDEAALANGREVLDEFAFRCASLGVKYRSSLVIGQVDESIIQRAYWSDMVVINQRKVHGRWAERPLGTIFHTVASQTARPILAVPGTQVTPLKRVVLAYDGSAKSREALFVLRHLVSCWQVDGVILSVAGGSVDREMLDQAWQYAQEGGGGIVSTRYLTGAPGTVIIDTMEKEDGDLLLMGGYGHRPLLKAFLGSTVDYVLREAWFPVLICR